MAQDVPLTYRIIGQVYKHNSLLRVWTANLRQLCTSFTHLFKSQSHFKPKESVIPKINPSILIRIEDPSKNCPFYLNSFLITTKLFHSLPKSSIILFLSFSLNINFLLQFLSLDFFFFHFFSLRNNFKNKTNVYTVFTSNSIWL